MLTVDAREGIPTSLSISPEIRKALEELVSRQQRGLVSGSPTLEEWVSQPTKHVTCTHDSALAHDSAIVSTDSESDAGIVGRRSADGHSDEDRPVAAGGIKRKRRDRYVPHIEKYTNLSIMNFQLTKFM